MEYYISKVEGIQIRNAVREDSALILDFIKQLSVYEKLEHMVVATEKTIEDTIFDRKDAEVLIAEYDGKPSGFALFFQNYSTFLSKSGIHLEDLFVIPELRGKGIGKELLRTLGEIAAKRRCGRLEWSCLDWNLPSITFYKSIGAKAMDEWTTYRIEI